MIDDDLIKSIVDYNIYRKSCFKNGTIPLFEDKEYEKILKARYNKVSRIRKRLLYIALRFNYLYFVTFTFDDSHLNLCDRSRKDLIKSALYSFDDNIHYILNIDYGKKNDRLHYHCIVATNVSDNLRSHLESAYPCFTWTERIRLNSNDYRKVSKYLNKLTNHAIKDTTKKSRVLYNFKGYDNLDRYLARQVFMLDSIRVGLT